MRYVSFEEARSDLFLSAAVYLIGPLIVGLLPGFNRVPSIIDPSRSISVVVAVLAITLPLVYTVLVPYLLIRYRKESVRDYLPKGGGRGFAFGLLLAVPVVAAVILATFVKGDPIQEGLPFLWAAWTVGALSVAQRLTSWLGVAALVIYATVKARDAFRSDPRTLRAAAVEIARVLGILVAITTLLMLLRLTRADENIADLLLWPLGIAAAFTLALTRLRGPNSTNRATLLTPVVILALPSFTLGPSGFVEGLYAAALLGGIGLIFGMIEESRYAAYGTLAMALVLALATPLFVPFT
jgi:hypothetical protein